MPDAFYLPDGDSRFKPSQHTAGPWTPDAQHFGPPSALLVRALEQLPADRPMALARVTVEILGPAPLTPLSVRARLDRPGRSVQLLSTELADGDRVVARATAWRFVRSDTAPVETEGAAPLPAVDSVPPAAWPDSWGGGYLDALEWRSVHGSPAERGPAAVWARQRVALVEGEEPTPLQRLFTVADSASGISNRLDPRDWLFINAELTVHVNRPPDGEWIGMDADTTIGPNGAGTARSVLHDVAGPVAVGTQSLLVRPR